MNIAVNLFAVSPRSKTGAFMNVENLLRALFEIDTRNTYHLLGQSETIAYFKPLYRRFPQVQYRTFDPRHDLFINPLRALRKLMAKARHDDIMRERIILKEVQVYLDRYHIDLYFSPSQSIYPKGLSCQQFVTTILDLQPEYFPENFSPDALAEKLANSRYIVDHSSRLIAISEFTKKTVVEKYGVDADRISVAYPAAHATDYTGTDMELPDEFVFYPAAVWPHKNHATLIRALGFLTNAFPHLHAVCTGVIKRKGLKQELETLAAHEGVSDRIHIMGYVPDEMLPTLYRRAKALVFPSVFEGFGIPVIEAFLYGLPVIASNNSSLAEITGDAGILVPTGDAKALAGAIERVLTDSALRDTLIKKGRERAKLFSWEKAAQETLAAFLSASSL